MPILKRAALLQLEGECVRCAVAAHAASWTRRLLRASMHRARHIKGWAASKHSKQGEETHHRLLLELWCQLSCDGNAELWHVLPLLEHPADHMHTGVTLLSIF